MLNPDSCNNQRSSMIYQQQQKPSSQRNVESLSPIKPNFGSSNENPNILGASPQMQFTHSTPNHSIPNHANSTRPAIKQSESNKSEQISKKQLIVKEIAVNILELNGYKTRTEQLDNELKNYNQLKNEINMNQSSRDFLSLSEKTEGIQAELDKLKGEMLQKIEDIHSLECELVKIEDSNTMNKSMNRNEEVMGEIRNMLKEMISSSSGTSNLVTVNNIYEEYSKALSQRRNVAASAVISQANHHSPQRKPSSIKDDCGPTNDKSTEHEYIYKRFETLRSQIERDYFNLLNQANRIEARSTPTIEPSNNTEDEEIENKTTMSILSELEHFKANLALVQDNLEREKFYLFKSFQGLNDATSRSLIASLGDSVERLLFDKHTEFDAIANRLSELVRRRQYDRERRRRCGLRRGSSESFMEEEEEAIELITEKIKELKTKIDTKDSCRSKSNGKGFNIAQRTSQDSETKDADGKELAHLNEQIRMLKSRMTLRGDELNKNMGYNRGGACYGDDGLTPCPGPIYIPITTTTANYHDQQPQRGEYQRNRGSRKKSTASSTYCRTESYDDCYYSSQQSDKRVNNVPQPPQPHMSVNQRIVIANNDERESSEFSDSDNRMFMVSQGSCCAAHGNNAMRSGRAGHQPSFSLSPEKKYTSSVEIPAELLKTSKSNSTSNHRAYNPRSKSESKTTSSATLGNDVRAKTITPLSSQEPALSVSFIKPATRQNQTQTDDDNIHGDCKRNVDRLNQEMGELRRTLDEKRDMIARLQEQHSHIDDLKSNELVILQQRIENSNHTIEMQKNEIMNLKNRLNEMSTLNNRLREELDEHKRKRLINQTTQTNHVKMATIGTTTEKEGEETLLCNIPEHHNLEDIVHNYQEQLENLKAYVREIDDDESVGDNLAILEKRAEFEALDLAINQRKQQLINLEMSKNRRMQEMGSEDDDNTMTTSDSNSENEMILRNEIKCLEASVRKRKLELKNIEVEMRSSKKELTKLKEVKNRIESDLEKLIKVTSKLTKEKHIVDKKADEATIELIVAKEELDAVKEEKKNVEKSIDSIKAELVEFLKATKSQQQKQQQSGEYYYNEYDLDVPRRSSINDQNRVLMVLNSEIEAKKREIDDLREKSEHYVDELKNDTRTYQNEVNGLKTQKEQLSGQLKTMRTRIDEANGELDEKARLLESSRVELERILRTKDKEARSLKEIEIVLEDKRRELENLDSNLETLAENFGNLRENESQLLRKLDTITANIKSENETYEDIKRVIENLISAKDELEARLRQLENEAERLSASCLDKEQQLSKLSTSMKERQAQLKRLDEERAELEREKSKLGEESGYLNEKLKKRRTDLDALEAQNRAIETKLTESRAEMSGLQTRLEEVKAEFERYKQALRDAEVRMRDLTAKCDSKKQQLDQINDRFTAKKDELDQVEMFLEDARNETQQEQKNFNSLHNEMTKQKRIYDELKSKLKTVNKAYEETQSKMKNMKELEKELESKDEHIIELEAKLSKKSHEFENLTECFKKNQEDTAEMRGKLADIEQKLRDGGGGFENVVSNPKAEYLKIITTTTTSSRPNEVSSLLITPTIRKSACLTTEQCIASSSTAVALDEPTRLREILAKNFEERYQNLERSKQQTRNIIESLKLNLNDIELMTANNIFKITSLS